MLYVRKLNYEPNYKSHEKKEFEKFKFTEKSISNLDSHKIKCGSIISWLICDIRVTDPCTYN
jgi:hypothetical protein